MKYANTVLDLVGNTPLVKLNKVTEGIKATVLVKVEYLNPGGSSKDRIAAKIIDAAEAQGLLKPGGTIVEPTSGNTGVGLAIVAQQRGYRTIFVVPDKVGLDKRNVLSAYGAEVVVAPTAVAPEDPRSYYSVSDRLVREIPGAYKPNQYSNQSNPQSHYETTGPEIWRDTEGKVTHFVAGVGTGGTIGGTGRYLKEVSNNAVQIIGADPEGSVYSGGTGRPYLVEGVGEDFWPETYDGSVIDEIIPVTDAESFELTRRLAREEGLLVGGSSGLAVAAALKAAAKLGEDDVVVVLLPDGGRGYLGKIFNDEWLESHGFLSSASETKAETANVAQLLSYRAQSSSLPELVYVHPDATIREAVRKLAQYEVSQLAVLSAEPPVVLGEVVGSLSEEKLLALIAGGSASLDDQVSGHLESTLPLVGINESLSSVEKQLSQNNAVLVISEGKPVTVISRQDLLRFLSKDQ